ncbi:MAG: glycosyltransferase, partial [Alphaproteobacteria bacterium]
ILLVDDSIPFDGYTASAQPLGGVEKAFASLPAALQRRGHEVRVINRCAFPIATDGVRWQPWESERPDACDVLIAHRRPALLDFPVKAAKRILWLDGPGGRLSKGGNMEILARHGDAPIVFYGLTHRRGCPDPVETRAVVIEPGVRRDYRDADAMDAAKPPRAIVTSHPKAGLDWLLDLWAKEIRPRAEGAELYVYSAVLDKGALGAEVPEAIKPVFDKAMALKGDGVIIQRPQADPLMADNYRFARAHLHPGRDSELYCSTLAESQAVGLPAVTRHTAAAAERVRDGASGFVVPDDEAYANCAMLLLTVDGVYKGRSIEAREFQRGRDWDDAAAEFESLFS